LTKIGFLVDHLNAVLPSDYISFLPKLGMVYGDTLGESGSVKK
jgi:hypothetical protein